MKKYIFKPYNAIYPTLFEKERKRLSKYITGTYCIEHVGSTAVPELGGKGIIDIYIAVSKDRLNEVSQEILNAGYQYGETASKVPPHIFHKITLKDPLEGTRLYYLHLTYPEYIDWKNVITFRNYLLLHPKDRETYASIKERAAIEAHEDGEKYMQIKSSFIQTTLKKALLEEPNK